MKLKLVVGLLLVLTQSFKCGNQLEGEPQVNLLNATHRQLYSSYSRSSYLSPVRFYFHYANFSLGGEEAYFKNTLIKAAERWLSSALNVYSLLEPLKLSGITKCGPVKVPYEHQTLGIETDVIAYVSSAEETEKSYVAYAGPCALQNSDRNNVIAGSIHINSHNFLKINSFEKQMMTVIHELTHLLGFTKGVYKYFRKSNGEPYLENELYETVEIRGVEKTTIKGQRVLEKAREALGCEELQGVELEDYGGDGTVGSHWDKRMMYNDYMIGHVIEDPLYSSITLALLEDSGWYYPNYTYAQTPIWPRQKSCSFFYNKCLEKDSYEFCSHPKDTCDYFHLGKAKCNLKEYEKQLPKEFQYFSNPKKGGSDPYVDYCPVKEPTSYGNCRGTGPLVYANPSYFEEICEDCRCFETTIAKDKASDQLRPVCYRVLCAEDHSLVQINNSTFRCPYEGGKIEAMEGHLICPEWKVLCGEVPCMNGCSGAGVCVSGKCKCSEGFTGSDCSIECSGDCTQEVLCPEGQTSLDSRCVCKPFRVFSNGKCKCVDNSQETKGECLCVKGTSPFEGLCIAASENLGRRHYWCVLAVMLVGLVISSGALLKSRQKQQPTSPTTAMERFSSISSEPKFEDYPVTKSSHWLLKLLRNHLTIGLFTQNQNLTSQVLLFSDSLMGLCCLNRVFLWLFEETKDSKESFEGVYLVYSLGAAGGVFCVVLVFRYLSQKWCLALSILVLGCFVATLVFWFELEENWDLYLSILYLVSIGLDLTLFQTVASAIKSFR